MHENHSSVVQESSNPLAWKLFLGYLPACSASFDVLAKTLFQG